MTRKISAKRLEALIARGATMRKRPEPAPEPEPTLEAHPPIEHNSSHSGSRHRGLRRIEESREGADKPHVPSNPPQNDSNIIASIDRLTNVMTKFMLNDHQDGRATRLTLNRDEFGFIESVDIVREKAPSGRQN